MDAKTHIGSHVENRPPNRRGTAGSRGSADAALHLRMSSDRSSIKVDLFDVGKIFKKTPYVADLRLRGRDVAKDMLEIANIPLLMKTLPDHGHPHQDVVRSAGKPITVMGGVVGLKANVGLKVSRAPEGAMVKVAGMSNVKFTGPASRFDSEPEAFESVTHLQTKAQILNVNLTGARPAARPTKWRSRETNPTSGVLRTHARQVERAVTRGGSPERQCDADI